MSKLIPLWVAVGSISIVTTAAFVYAAWNLWRFVAWWRSRKEPPNYE